VESQIEPAHALVFPYLWIRGRMTVGPYEIISRGALTDDDFTSPQMKSELEGLLKMHEARGSMADRFGSVVRRRDGKVGDRFERDEMRPLRRAMVAALLDGTRSRSGRRRTPKAGTSLPPTTPSSTCTSSTAAGTSPSSTAGWSN
jgi:hypothetical protein